MAPNLIARTYCRDEYSEEDHSLVSKTHHYDTGDSELRLGKVLWTCIKSHRQPDWNNLQAKFTSIPLQKMEHAYHALSSVAVLGKENSEATHRLLQDFQGYLMNVPVATIDWLYGHLPTTFHARVADFNNNLFYSMQEHRGLNHLVETDNDQHSLQILEDALKETLGCHSVEYQASFMMTEETNPQPPHVDFTWEVLREYKSKLTLAFSPLTEDGCFLQIWPRNDTKTKVEGQVVYIPYGKCLLLPSDTIHGGGFKSCAEGNLRFHLYISVDESQLPSFQTNKYTEEYNKGLELANRYVHAPHMLDMLESLMI